MPNSVALREVFGKLHLGKWETWDEKERTALKTFLAAMWDEILSHPSIEGYLVNMETWLCSIGRCEDDLTPYLNQWLMDERLSASLALSNLVCDSAIVDNDDSQRDPYWAERDAQYRQLKTWVSSPPVIWKLRRAETHWRDRGLSGQFTKARRLISESANQEFK